MPLFSSRQGFTLDRVDIGDQCSLMDGCTLHYFAYIIAHTLRNDNSFTDNVVRHELLL
jgi:hypothetical protein